MNQPENDLESIFKILKSYQGQYAEFSKEIIELPESEVNTKDLKIFALFISESLNALVNKGYVEFLLNLSIKLIENLSPRLGIHRFSQKQLNEEGQVFFDYFRALDNKLEKLTNRANSFEFLSNHEDIRKILKEKLPVSEQKDFNEFQTEKYIFDYLDTISHWYDSFLVLCLYLLIIYEITLKKPYKNDLDLFENNQKMSVDRLYKNRGKLRDCIKEGELEDNLKNYIVNWIDQMFGDEGLRQFRLSKTHHLGEEKMKFSKQDMLLQVTYPSGTKKSYTLNDIRKIKNNTQMIVFIGFFLINEIFYHYFQKLLEAEQKEAK